MLQYLTCEVCLGPKVESNLSSVRQVLSVPSSPSLAVSTSASRAFRHKPSMTRKHMTEKRWNQMKTCRRHRMRHASSYTTTLWIVNHHKSPINHHEYLGRHWKLLRWRPCGLATCVESNLISTSGICQDEILEGQSGHSGQRAQFRPAYSMTPWTMSVSCQCLKGLEIAKLRPCEVHRDVEREDKACMKPKETKGNSWNRRKATKCATPRNQELPRNESICWRADLTSFSESREKKVEEHEEHMSLIYKKTYKSFMVVWFGLAGLGL